MSKRKVKAITIEEVRREIVDLDPTLDTSDESFRVAVVLASSPIVGTDLFDLATFTGENIEWLALLGSRWQASGVWADGRVCGNWSDPETGGIEFWMDVLVGQGLVERIP